MRELDILKHRLAEEQRARKQADAQLVEHANELEKARKGLGDLASTIAGIPYPVLQVDANGRISFSNPASIRHWSHAVVPGASLHTAFPFVQDIDIEDIIEGDRVFELRARKKGEYFRFVFKGDARQQVCHLYCLDVTEYERERQEHQRAQHAFLARGMLAHDSGQQFVANCMRYRGKFLDQE